MFINSQGKYNSNKEHWSIFLQLSPFVRWKKKSERRVGVIALLRFDKYDIICIEAKLLDLKRVSYVVLYILCNNVD